MHNAHNKLRVCLIGAGNIKYHYQELLGIQEKDFNKTIGDIAKTLADTDSEIVLLPDRGISFEISKKYKSVGGKKIIGLVPTSDKDFGIKHLEEYINAKVNNKKLIDQIIDTGTWYKQDLTHCLFGDVILMLGNSLGSLGELVYGFYLYKLFIGIKPNIEVIKKKIHLEIRAGEYFQFSVIIYKPFMKDKLNFEICEYIKEASGQVIYVDSPEELKEKLEELKKSDWVKSVPKSH